MAEMKRLPVHCSGIMGEGCGWSGWRQLPGTQKPCPRCRGAVRLSMPWRGRRPSR